MHTLCETLGIKTPSYKPLLVPHLHQIHSLLSPKTPLGVLVLHTPGHTPDELALYDVNDKMLFVGDSLYEHEPIIFPKEGSILTWFSSVDFLIKFVTSENEKGTTEGSEEVRINSGHRTVVRPAMEVIEATKAFMMDVVQGREVVRKRMTIREEESVEYRQDGGRFALRCPERLVLEARVVYQV